MKAHQIVDEHKKGVRAKKYNKKPKAYITPKKPVAGPVQGVGYGADAGHSGVSEDTDNKPQLMTAFTKFLPLAMHALALKKLPKIKLEKIIIDHEQPTFGKYDDSEQIIYLAIENRHALDILRTLAHELIHFKQNTEHRLDVNSGGTGSEIENEANAQAAIIMRHFNKKYPEFFKDSAVDLKGVDGDQSLEERKKKRRVRNAAYGPGLFGGYGYYAGYSGDSGASDGGDGGESIKNEDAMMGKIADSGKIIRILKKAHTVPFSDEKNWLLIDVDPAKGNKGLGLKWIPADTRFEWVRPYRDTVDENFANYQGVRPPKNVPGTNLFPGQDIVGQRVYHCTNRLEAIKKSGGLKPRRDATGEREYGRLSTDEHPFIPVIGIWFSVGKPDWPGKHCVSFVIEPTDQVYVAYANTKGLKPNVVLNPIALDRLTVEGQQDVAENFADGRNPQDKGDSKRHGVPTKASISTLRNVAKQGGRKGQLAHWMANMKSGREK